MKRCCQVLVIYLLGVGWAGAQGVYKKTAEADYNVAYQKIYAALEENRFYVVHEIDIGKSLAHFKDKWADYNQNQLQHLRVMLICNGRYTNRVSNADPDMLALCPLRVTVHHQRGVTTALFARPSVFAQDSKALPILKEAESIVIKAINNALQ